MADENAMDKSWGERLRDNYRLVVMNNETFEEVGSYKLSLLNVYILFSGIAVLVACLVFALIVLTPIKRYIPGYGEVKQSEIMSLNRQIQDMEKQLEAQKSYTDNFRKILVGEVELDAETEAGNSNVTDTMLDVERIKEDELLRKEIELDEQIQEKNLLAKTANFSSQEQAFEQLYLMPPISGIISSGYDYGDKHFGVDVMAPKNTPIKAVLDGYVFIADWTLETGHTIGLQHSNNLITFYKHNSALLKSIGDNVKAGEAIAIVGNSGTLSNGPHLHFELWQKGKPIDPAKYIRFE